MGLRFVLALFDSKGLADDAGGRLVTEGVAAEDVAVRVLHEIAPIPPKMNSELAALDADPFVWGNARETFARFIRNGETVVSVRARTEAAAQFAIDTLQQYVPRAIEILVPENP
jgi:hypothetical protein